MLFIFRKSYLINHFLLISEEFSFLSEFSLKIVNKNKSLLLFLNFFIFLNKLILKAIYEFSLFISIPEKLFFI